MKTVASIVTLAFFVVTPATAKSTIAQKETGPAIFAGAVDGDRFERRLSSSGDYTIKVYIYRAFARRGFRSKYTRNVVITDAAATAPSGDAKVAGTAFHATGQIPCAQYEGQPMAQCRFGVIRRGNGDATVRVFWPGGGERNIYFKSGKVDSSDSSGGVRSERSSDLNRIFIGPTERFEIPDAVIFGG